MTVLAYMAASDNNLEIIRYLQSNKILHSTRTCDYGHKMSIEPRKDVIDKYRWRCSKCSQSIGLRKNTFLNNICLSFQVILKLIMSSSVKGKQSSEAKFSGCDRKTIANFQKKLGQIVPGNLFATGEEVLELIAKQYPLIDNFPKSSKPRLSRAEAFVAGSNQLEGSLPDSIDPDSGTESNMEYTEYEPIQEITKNEPVIENPFGPMSLDDLVHQVSSTQNAVYSFLGLSNEQSNHVRQLAENQELIFLSNGPRNSRIVTITSSMNQLSAYLMGPTSSSIIQNAYQVNHERPDRLNSKYESVIDSFQQKL